MRREREQFPMQRFEEDQAIQALSNQFEALLSENDLPMAFVLLATPSGLLSEESVLAERSERLTSEKWTFVVPVQSDGFSSMLPQSTNQKIAELAGRLGIGPDTVIMAAIGTKALAENFQGNSVAVRLHGGPEVVRLTRVIDQPTSGNGLVAQARSIRALQYYSCFRSIDGRPISTLLAHGKLEEADFQSIFPPLLVFYTHVVNKHQLQQNNGVEAPAEVS